MSELPKSIGEGLVGFNYKNWSHSYGSYEQYQQRNFNAEFKGVFRRFFFKPLVRNG